MDTRQIISDSLDFTRQFLFVSCLTVVALSLAGMSIVMQHIEKKVKK